MVHISKRLYPVSTGVVSATTAARLFGPIEINDYQDLSFVIYNCSTVNLNLKLYGSYDAERKYSSEIPHNLLASNDFVARPSDVHANVFARKFMYNFLTIGACATASIGASQVEMYLTARKK
jgi:hypothetical protein